MKLIGAMDLHSNNVYTGIITLEGKRVLDKRLPNKIDVILAALEPYRKDLTSIAVESTYNWYWLVDGLEEDAYKMVLAHPGQMQQYSGLKHADDRSDTFWMAEMLRLGILPTGHIYDRETRPLRDLLRRRMWLVQQRTDHLLSLISMITRHTGSRISTEACYKLDDEKLAHLFPAELNRIAAQALVLHIQTFRKTIRALESIIRKNLKERPEYDILKTTPGIGNTLAATMALEVGDISRFESAGNYASYCRCVQSKWTSNNKKKGKGTEKNGNKYLGWAYVEAANFAGRFDEQVHKYIQRKTAKKNRCVAIKSTAAKLAKANYYMIRDQEPFDITKVFGS